MAPRSHSRSARSIYPTGSYSLRTSTWSHDLVIEALSNSLHHPTPQATPADGCQRASPGIRRSSPPRAAEARDQLSSAIIPVGIVATTLATKVARAPPTARKVPYCIWLGREDSNL